MVPPSYEKDQGPVRDALRELAAFVAAFPRSPYLEKAKKLEEDCIRRLAEHEIYVADFYMRRDHPLASVGRLEGLVRGDFLPKLATEASGEASERLSTVARAYLKANLEPEVLLLLGRTYMKMNKPELARQAFERLIATHPDDYHAKKARLFLDHLARASR
jgi:outer membrane protein assembly factor BamD